MKKPIHVLIVEDSEFDARILVNTLRQGGYDPLFRRVETADAMRQALEDQKWDVILSDYNLPQFSAPDALRVLQASSLDLPFLIISGGIGEDIAVAAMKAGAHDYLMKGNLARLVPAVEREMREAASRQAGRASEAAFRESEQRNRLLWENSTDAVLMMEADGVIRFANPAVERVFGYPPVQVVGQNFRTLLGSEARQGFPRWAAECLSSDGVGPPRPPVDTVGCHRERREVFIEIAFTTVRLQAHRMLVAFVRDITERRQAEEESRLLQGISLAVSTAGDLDTALAVVLRAVCEASGWSLGQAWLPWHDASVLSCSPACFCTSDGLAPFRAASECLRLHPGQGLPGRAWQTRAPVWFEDLPTSSDTLRAETAREVGIVAAAAIPVLAGDQVVAVIEFFLRERREEDVRMLKLFGAIAAQLGVAIQRKSAEHELRANEEEFRAARDIQERLFPKAPPVLPGIDIAGRSHAASAAGGDYFDYLPMLDGRWGLAVGDVAGHGMGPALLMAEARAYLRVLAQSHREVDAILTTANRVLVEDVGAERFITLLLVSLDPITLTLTFANAGHPAGYVLAADGSLRHTLRRTGVPLGIQPDTVYAPAPPIQLTPGDIVVLLTDGIEEAMAADDALFGVERTLEVIRAAQDQPAQVVVERLFDAVRAHTRSAPQMDDATAVVIRVAR